MLVSCSWVLDKHVLCLIPCISMVNIIMRSMLSLRYGQQVCHECIEHMTLGISFSIIYPFSILKCKHVTLVIT